MLLALIAFVKMLKRRASKRFVLVESGEEPQSGAGGVNNNDSATSGSISIPNFVAIEHTNSNDDLQMIPNSNNINNNESTSNLLTVPSVATLK
ncbi:uncharacterized protein Dwil_GK27095 [Drosophila willistoni]|nr:uncharacterized protein Dwil_GK27095 [Drosophila willistoni]